MMVDTSPSGTDDIRQELLKMIRQELSMTIIQAIECWIDRQLLDPIKLAMIQAAKLLNSGEHGLTKEILETIVQQIPETLSRAIDEKLDSQLQGIKELDRLKQKELLTPAEVTALYGLKVATLETWRCRGGGPDFLKLGGKLVYYRHVDIRAYLNAHMVKGHS